MKQSQQFIAFQSSLSDSIPNADWPPLLQAMWYDGKGDWDKAHDIADGYPSLMGYRVHAYLHRKERDDWNADYWYRKAGTVRPEGTLRVEWEMIVKELLLATNSV